MPDLKGLLAFVLVLVLASTSQAWAVYDGSHLKEPNITMTPNSGPPGTKITITVSDFPDISGESYPYPDFYIYIPFADALGSSNVPTQCGKNMCFPIYTYEEAQKKNFVDKTVSFTLFSSTNPKPIYLNGLLHSVCDIVVNSKVQQSFADICNTKSQPTGDYEIQFAWAAKTKPNEPYFIKTLKFQVTEGTPPTKPTGLRLDQTLMDLYKEGVISEQTFEAELKGLGYSDTQIRDAKAVLGKLPHQQKTEPSTPEKTIKPNQNDTMPEETTKPKQNNTITQETIKPEEKPKPVLQQPSPTKGCLIATASFGSEMAPQVQLLRELRDNTLLKTSSGSAFMVTFDSVYYTFSPTIAELERQNPIFKEMIKAMITPLISTLSILNYLNINSEFKMVTYGIGIILLNIGMYFVSPAILVVKINSLVKKKRLTKS